MYKIEDVLNFWFQDLSPNDWFKKDPQLDKKISDKFSNLLYATIAGELFEWRRSATGTLAQVIVLDQFSRNIFRDRKEAFSQDPLALAIAQDAIEKGFDLELSIQQRGFLYMPFMHSESAFIHRKAAQLFSLKGLELNLDFELKHKAIIDRFGRYPHRNIILNRESTAEEKLFLQEQDSAF